MKAYPIKFKPLLKTKPWGGDKLSKLLNKTTNSTSIGESWEISGVKDNLSEVVNGIYAKQTIAELIDKYQEDFLGQKNWQRFGNEFPLLIKFLDAKSNLSLQVHPDDSMAQTYHNSYGKTEMWYIMDSDQEAEVIVGLKEPQTKKSFFETIHANNIDELFNVKKVRPGQSYFIPSGQIHGIGAGVLAAEIQQTSDITYRIYDWDRKDDCGRPRELHTEKAFEAAERFLSKGKQEIVPKTPNTLVDCEFFTTNIMQIKQQTFKSYDNLDSFVIFMCVEGNIKLEVDGTREELSYGQTALIPASANRIMFNSKSARLLEIYIK